MEPRSCVPLSTPALSAVREVNVFGAVWLEMRKSTFVEGLASTVWYFHCQVIAVDF